MVGQGLAPPALPCGSWPSPVSSELLVRGSRGLSGPAFDGDDLYWVEGRPDEGGRQVLVRRRQGALEDVVGAPFNVRSRVHEYGGDCHLVDGGTVFFSDFSTGRLHVAAPGGEPRALTPEGDLRYADLDIDRARGRLVCVLEDHTTGAREAVNTIVAVPVGGGEPRPLCTGHDFVAAPRVSPDGTMLAWVTWDHPAMPWDETALWVAPLGDGGLPGSPRRLAGGPGVSALQPCWAPDGALWFSDDRSGWWNLHRWEPGTTAPVPVAPMEAETAGPLWQLGQQWFRPLPGGGVVAVTQADGRWRLLAIRPGGGPAEELAPELTVLGGRVAVHASTVALVAAGPTREAALVTIDVETGSVEVVRTSSAIDLDPACISVAEPVRFASAGGRRARAYFYPPRSPVAAVPAGELPPLRVLSHGGPTASASPALDWEVQYWTTRGIAVLDVDYGGSTGYGRAYRQLLRGRWGEVDVEDCVAGARHLAALGLVDGSRLCIEGGSAGGFTTLRALVETDVFAAGCSRFGVGDLEALATDTHKFESRYLDGIVGPYPERRDLYVERSPLHHADRLRVPVILFQGSEDRVVPPEQSRRFHEAARTAGVLCAYVEFEGEGHGFRRAENIRRSLDGELAFYGLVFGFSPADPLDPPLEADNLSS